MTGRHKAVMLGSTLLLAGAIQAAEPAPTSRPTQIVAEGGAWVVLHGDTGPDVVRLVLELRGWPEQVEGFQFRRRPLDADGQSKQAWENMHVGAIVPQVTLDRDYREVESDPQEQARLKQRLAEMVRKGQTRVLDAKQFKALIRGANDKELRALRRETVNDFDNARMMGLGFADRQVGKDDSYEYGLFAVTGGKAEAVPLATYSGIHFKATDERLKVTDLAASREEKGITLAWRFPEESVQRWSLFGFQVYRAEAGTDRFTRITPDKIGGPSVREGYRHWLFADTAADPMKSFTYAVVPVNVFDTEMPVRTTITYVPAPPAPAKLAVQPLIKRVQQLNKDNGFEVTWEAAEKVDPKLVKGYVVERADLPDREMKAISKVLPGDARSFVDKEGQKAHQRQYAYRVTAMGTDGPLANSAPYTVLYLDFPTPPKPTNVTAASVEIKGKRYIQIKWAGKLDNLTRGFQIYADNMREGQLLRQASIPIVVGNEFLYEVAERHDRGFKIGVAGVGEGGKESEPVQVACFTVGERPADVKNLKVVRGPGDAAAIRLSWEYTSTPQLAGFRVMEGDRVLANERTLTAGAREWVLPKPVPGRAYAFTVTAVRASGVASMGVMGTTGGGAIAGVVGQDIPAAPADLRAEWVELEGRKVVKLRWSVADGAAPAGYQLAVDSEFLGRLENAAAIQIAKPGEYVFVPAKPEPRTYRFSLEALNAVGMRGSPAQVACLAPGRTVAPVLLDRITQVPASNGRKLLLQWKPIAASRAKGFRVYMDDKLLANEEALSGSTYEFTTAELTGSGIRTFTVEAVGETGDVSERSAGQRYLVN